MSGVSVFTQKSADDFVIDVQVDTNIPSSKSLPHASQLSAIGYFQVFLALDIKILTLSNLLINLEKP